MLRILLGLFLFAGAAQAAKPVLVTVEPRRNDALVTIDVLVEKGDPDFQLQLKAFTLSGETQETHTDVSKAEQTENIRVAETLSANTAEDFRIVSKEFQFSIAEIVVPAGKEAKLGFVVAAIGPEKAQLFDMPSRLFTIETRDGRTEFVLNPKGVEPDRGQPVEAFKMVEGAKRPEKLKEAVPAFPSSSKDESIKAQELEQVQAEEAKENPQDLAGTRKDKVQALSKDENLVYFATNRKIETIRNRPGQYKFLAALRARGIAGLTYGVCNVDLPTRAQEQAWWSKEKAAISKTVIYSEGVFLQNLSNTTSKDVFLFIHGYANTFEDVILQAGRMKRDLKFPGNVMAWSWPSAGKVTSYGDDEEFADGDDSLAAFDHVLKQVVTHARSQGGRVYLLAHSMGNRFLVHGLRKLYLDSEMKRTLTAEPKEKRTLAVVAFAAPDVDINLFSSAVPSVTMISNLVSFYYSTKDRALDLSEVANEMNRAGRHPLFHDDVATINVDRLKTWFSSGHCYYSEADRALLDVYLQFHYHLKADRRLPPLEADKETERKLLFKHWFLTEK